MANFVIHGLRRGPRISSRARRAIMGAFRDASKILAAMLLLSVSPAFALQRGGGGHSGGGGGHFSGGGGGHASSAPSHPSGGGQHSSVPHPTNGHLGATPAPRSGATVVRTDHSSGPSGTAAAGRTPQTTHIAAPGYVWEATPGYANRVGPETPKDLGKRGFLWEETPSNKSASEKNSYFLTSNLLPRADAAPRQVASGTFLARGSASHPSNSIAVNRRPIPAASLGSRPVRIIRTRAPFGFGRSRVFFGGFFPFGFFPGFFYDNCFAFGYDFAFVNGFGGPCGNGYMYPGFGLYPGGTFSDYTVVSDGTQPGEPTDGAPSGDEAIAPQGAEAPAPGPDTTVLYLKDGTSFGVADYWLESGRLHYVTTYGGANAMGLDELDMQRTVDENAKQGNDFTLRPPHWQDQDALPQQ